MLEGSVAHLHVFAAAIDSVGYAHLRLKDLQFSVAKLSASNALAPAAKTIMIADLVAEFELKYLAESQPIIGNALGAITKAFLKSVRQPFIAEFGVSAARVRSGAVDARRAAAVLKELREKHEAEWIKEEKKRGGKRELLAESSPLLARFEQFAQHFERLNNGRSAAVELPGQYAGDRRPEPALHVTIAGFAPHVQVMSSLRKPKAITALGNDQKEYKMLVKTGEDLRLDQRVQDLFAIMNDVLAGDAVCRRRGLRLDTYAVTPMSSGLGVLAWLPHSTTLKSIVTARDEGAAFAAARKHWEEWQLARWRQWVAHDRTKRLASIDEQQIQGPFFTEGLAALSADDMALQMREAEACIPEDALRASISERCASADAFLAVRRAFAASFATLSMANFILGVGDRHLDNWLFLQDSGRVAAIDFGAAFGMGLNMPIPELMPIRLTRQLRSFFAPLDTTGLLAHDMVHALTALRRGREALLPTFAVFVNEPIAEWVEASVTNKERGGGGGGGGAGAGGQWYPRKKVHFTKLKLQGYNPSAVMEAEMRATSFRLSHLPCFEAIIDVVRGAAGSVRRALSGDRPLTAAEQVDALIEQSADPNVVGRVFIGWAPFA